jgi:hypothetical protein
MARRGPLAPPPDDRDDDYEPTFGDRAGEEEAEPTPEPDYDPHREAQGGLPASVLIGLALLPFLIPILWLIASAVAPQQPALTVVAPIALAVSASVLCLAVISTIDWTPGTRIRGVFLLVGLSYLAGVGLYFLNKDRVDGVRRFFGATDTWPEFAPPGGGYSVRMPTPRQQVQDQPLGLAPLACHKATQRGVLGSYSLVAGSANPNPPPNPNEAPRFDSWFDRAVDDVVGRCPGGVLESAPQPVLYKGVYPGREFVVKLGDTGSVRVVRVYLIKTRVYYLAVEGPGLDPGEDLVRDFFGSLKVADAQE